jgi:carboxyl-terminal processing protease
MRKLPLFLSGVALGALMLVGVDQIQRPANANNASETYRRLTLFGEVFDKIRADYVDKPDEAKLIESAINGMVQSLDPHSTFLDQKSNQEMQQTTRGEFGGLGIEVQMEDGLVKVVTPFDDSPAAKAGVRANDLVTHIDNDQVQGLTLGQAVDKMKGPKGTKVKLKLLRAKKDVVEVEITRDTIRPPVVRALKEGDNVGYIRIGSFNEQTFEGLKKSVEQLTKDIGKDKLKGFVIDLRNNPGGLLDQAIYVADAFLESGEIVSTRGKSADQTNRALARAGDITNGKPVVVLVNGGSASASEIVAGALQDHARATIVGTRSFGKGSVQSIFQLRGSYALKLTTQLYYTPSGRSIQGKGIMPDIIVTQDVPEELKGKDEIKGEASIKGHIKVNQDEEQSAGSSGYVPPDREKDKQIIWAVKFLKGEVSKSNLGEGASLPGKTQVKAEAKTDAKTDAPKGAAPKTPEPPKAPEEKKN